MGGFGFQGRNILALKQVEETLFSLTRNAGQGHQCPENPHVPQIDPGSGRSGCLQGGGCQTHDLEIGRQVGVAIKFGTQLEGFPARLHVGGVGVEHPVAVAEAGYARAVQQVGIDPRHLRRHVGAHTQGATSVLIHQLESAQIQLAASTRQQRFQIFDQRRLDQLIAPACVKIKQPTAEGFQSGRLVRQHIGNGFRQQPLHHDI